MMHSATINFKNDQNVKMISLHNLREPCINNYHCFSFIFDEFLTHTLLPAAVSRGRGIRLVVSFETSILRIEKKHMEL